MILNDYCRSPVNGMIAYKQFDIDLQLEKPDPVSSFPVSTLRGGFGITLRKLVCPTIEISCNSCILRHNCVYAYLFETVPQKDIQRMQHYKALPHPFTLWCKQNERNLTVSLLLIGNAINHLPYFIYTLRKLGTQGLGKNHNRYELATVTTGDTVLYENGSDDVKIDFIRDSVTFQLDTARNGSCTIEFYSPLVLRKEGRPVGGYDHYSFFSTLLRRLSSLYVIHCNGTNFEDTKPLLSSWTEQVKAQTSLAYTSATRFSTRQQQHIDYDGFTGKIELSGNIGAFMPFLKAGEIVAVGKNTAFGFGRYRVGDLKWD
ncbi:MAG TPA: CRISPR system precrRNA processing endoribonuclease RAMP protein Cas6 [Chitinispirillaceae bacterium]|nr:CRISPR system precrRNA processing endoribonuclease RAMP protein Cas6 [Chitinispirillaceae bacterium]